MHPAMFSVILALLALCAGVVEATTVTDRAAHHTFALSPAPWLHTGQNTIVVLDVELTEPQPVEGFTSANDGDAVTHEKH
jgi:hypothetical protein